MPTWYRIHFIYLDITGTSWCGRAVDVGVSQAVGANMAGAVGTLRSSVTVPSIQQQYVVVVLVAATVAVVVVVVEVV